MDSSSTTSSHQPTGDSLIGTGSTHLFENSSHFTIYKPTFVNYVNQSNNDQAPEVGVAPGQRTMTDIQSVDIHSKLSDMKELEDYLLRGISVVEPRARECIQGTREEILADIANRTDNLDGPNIICIYGAPGCGKSSISLTVRTRLQDQGRLITYFRFDRTEASITTSSTLWLKVAFELADRYPSVLKHSLSLLRDKKLDRTSTTMRLFTSLVEEPLLNLTETLADQSVVVIIDALDECGGRDGRSSLDRQTLLQIIRCWPKLPKCFKLLITSRDERDISQALSSSSNATVYIPSGNLLTDNPKSHASIHVSEDILTFLKTRLQQIAERLSLGKDWPGNKILDDMVQRAAGNFMWVVTTTNFIDLSLDPEEQLEKVMDPTSQSSGLDALYSLYKTILETSFGNLADSDSSIGAVRAVLGSAVYAKRPLSDEECVKLPTPKPIRPIIIRSIRDALGSVIVKGGDLRFVHKSFDDFLLSDECPAKYRIRADESQCLLTRLCAATMNTELHFNMCNLETSFLKNVDIPDLEIKVEHGISGLLSYSCRFWAEHLAHTPCNDELLLQVKDVVYDKLLYWFEAMSLLKEVGRVSHSLWLVQNWLNARSDAAFKDFLHDAHRFIGAFGQPIAQSTTHIYISALPFSPEHSLVAMRFLSRFPRTLVLSTGTPINWSPCIFTSKHHKRFVCSIAFSPDEKYFVSGSSDSTICICDADTGNLIAGLSSGSTNLVVKAFFDPGGHHVLANRSDGRVISWNVETGNQLLSFEAGWSGGDVIGCCRFNGGPNIVSVSSGQGAVILWSGDTGERLKTLLEIPVGNHFSKVSFSLDGRYMAWAGKDDRDIRIWSLVDESEIKGQLDFEGHSKPISTLSSSVDSMYVVSGSKDGTILVWDVHTGDIMGNPLNTGMGNVDAVAYSPKNGVIVSATGDPGTVMVWNASTHEMLLGPLGGHTNMITSIVLARDGRRALSASWDKTVRMWDLGGKDILHTRASHGHANDVMCVTFSPCGEKLGSLGDDMTIRIWDSRTTEPLVSPIHLNSCCSDIIFSPDGRKIAVCDYGTLKMWNVSTGELVLHQDLSDGGKRVWHYLAFRSIDNQLVTCSRKGAVRIWSENGCSTEGLYVSNPQPLVASVAFEILSLSPDGLTVLVYDKHRNPPHYLWGTTTYRTLDLPFPGGEKIDRAAFSPSGKFLATSHYRQLRVWNTQTGELTSGPSTLDDELQCLAFSPNDRHIAFAYYSSTVTSIWVWSARISKVVSGPWHGHTKDIDSLRFSADGKNLVSGSGDGQLRIWDTADLVEDSEELFKAFSDATHMEDGWIMSENGELLFWVPNDHRARLSWDRSVAVIGGERGIPTQVNLARFRYGEKWMECYE